jgi:RES domain-containing protein
MLVYRIVAEKYAHSLTASGRAGRWNFQDEQVIYASSSRSLATLELLVNRAGIHIGISYKVLVIEIPDQIQKVNLEILPVQWRGLRSYPALQNLGSGWYHEKVYLALQVPSAVIPKESNFVLNTLHSNYASRVRIIEVEDYFWDERF